MVHTSQHSYYYGHRTMTGIFSMFWKMDASVIRYKREIFLLSCNRYTMTVLSSEPNAYNGLN
jgi:hypothetical protein